MERPEIGEVDWHLVIVGLGGCLAVDALVVLEVPGREPDALDLGAWRTGRGIHARRRRSTGVAAPARRRTGS